MDAEVAQRLIALNKEFYQNLASPFSATRARLQPGVLRVLEDVPENTNVLDLGCGNGGVAIELIRRGHAGRYVGIDSSAELLDAARTRAQHAAPARPGLEFTLADLSTPNWSTLVPTPSFDLIFAFAVLHHLPSREIRLDFLRQVSMLLASPAGGRFVLSNWQFLNSPRLKARIQPWEKIGLSEEQVDEGDYLLDWRSGGQGLRYVHHFDAAELAELAELAAETGFRVTDSFLSDGKSRNLALYQVWKAA